MFSKIIELKAIREQKSRLSEREKELAKPLLKDLSLLNLLYQWFNEISSCKESQKERMLQRKKFIFIALSLYSPSTLAGDKMRIGLRDELCKVLEINEKSTLSKSLNNIAFYYQMYKYFRLDIDVICTEILKRLRDEKLIE